MALKNFAVALAAFGAVFVVTSCVDISTDYRSAYIRVVTDRAVLSPNEHLVNGETLQEGAGYDAQMVGNMQANYLAQHGWRDVTVLVELVSRGNAEPSPLGGWVTGPNLWRVEIYRP